MGVGVVCGAQSSLLMEVPSQAGESRLEASLGCILMGERDVLDLGCRHGAVRRQVCPGKNVPARGKRFLPSFISAALFPQASHCAYSAPGP